MQQGRWGAWFRCVLVAITAACGDPAPPAADDARAEAPAPDRPRHSGLPPAPPPLTPRGLVKAEPAASDGYVLFSPILSKTTYLVDGDGRVVHLWPSDLSGSGEYLQGDGSLLHAARDPELLHFRFGGVSGVLRRSDWDGNVLWEWRLGDEERVLHHDIEPLPNGNLLALAWERKTPQEAIAAGRRAEATPELGLLSEMVLEIEPIHPEGAKVVWEWHAWDHLVQDHDPDAPNHGRPADHPGRIDLNTGAGAAPISPDELAQLQALGYVPPEAKPDDVRADFLHANAIDYHPGLDQIAISVPMTSEVWILDHGTTTQEAAGPRGDLLYRWGNAAAWGRGEGSPRRLYFQHDVRWIPEGQQRAGNLTVFDNGGERPEGPFSSVTEIQPPLLPDGSYAREADEPYGPAEPVWTAKLAPEHFAPFISGAERLRGGNTFVCSGPDGVLLELAPSGEILWEYRNPFSGDATLADGSPVGPGMDDRPYAVFRASKLPADHPAFAGRALRPLDPQPAPRD